MHVVVVLSDDDAEGCCEKAAPSSGGLTHEQVSADIQIALQLQRREDNAGVRLSSAHGPCFARDTSRDAELAAALQREEEEKAGKRRASDAEFAAALQWEEEEEDGRQLGASAHSRMRLDLGKRSRSPQPRELPEELPLDSDAVALLRGCAAKASDAARSKFFFSGPTPFYHQHRPPRRRSSSGPGEVNKLIAPVDRADNWSCGYRNIQMLVGHLLISGWPSLFGGKVPSVGSLQMELERCWAGGFDPAGRQQLGGRVVATQKWIGTSEACVLLRAKGVRCNIVSFRGGGGLGGESCETAAAAVVERAIRHFSSGDGAKPRPPLYLQHDGHSRTIVGVQRRQESSGSKDFLLVLDPALGEHGFADFKAAAAQGRGWEKFVKRSLAPLQRKGEYELLVLEPDRPLQPSEMSAAHLVTRAV
eukprot:TRINITY_DN72007_c0_g1_i1.p1 TRINITY_DN72007_c0_g1~~TRINITY_DN72007_c0_g1_i1.p1  ORF type:complete len:419 (+),score=66.70 TRINITY_DN72007_c0_g1_i1:16-1272(+)